MKNIRTYSEMITGSVGPDQRLPLELADGSRTNESRKEQEIEMRRVLHGAGVKSIPFEFFVFLLANSSTVSIDGGPRLGIDGKFVRDKWAKLEPVGTDDLYFFSVLANKEVPIDAATGGFVVWNSSEERHVTVSVDYACTPAEVEEDLEEFNMEVTPAIRSEIKRFDKSKKLFGI